MCEGMCWVRVVACWDEGSLAGAANSPISGNQANQTAVKGTTSENWLFLLGSAGWRFLTGGRHCFGVVGEAVS